MSRLRVVPYRELRRVAERAGFSWVRCEGSHNTFRNSEGRTDGDSHHGDTESTENGGTWPTAQKRCPINLVFSVSSVSPW